MKQYFSQHLISKYAVVHIVTGTAFVGIFLAAVFAVSPNIAPEFSGSSFLRLVFHEERQETAVAAALDGLPYTVTPERISETEYTLTARALGDEEYAGLLNRLTDTVGVHTIIEFQSFSPSVSRELIRKAVIALIIAAVIIVIYISFVFRGVSRPVSSWKYGAVSIVALLHDIIAPLGVFALLAPFTSAAVDTLFVTALLATLGYSINDTIVIFDRIRDRLRHCAERNKREDFGATVDYGVRRSIRRSVYTSVSTMIPLALLFALVPVTQWFGVALFVGILAGTYSSLFFAPSLLLLWHRHFPQKEPAERKKTDTEKADEALRETLRHSNVL